MEKENPTLDMLIKLADALAVEIWEMFDFGHVENQKELKEAILRFSKPQTNLPLRLAFKVIRQYQDSPFLNIPFW